MDIYSVSVPDSDRLMQGDVLARDAAASLNDDSGLGSELAPPIEGKLPKLVIVVTLMATIGGLLFGYDTGVVAGAMLFMRGILGLDYVWQQLVVSVTTGACAISAFFAGPLSDWFGRRHVIMAASVIFTLAAIVLGAAPNKECLLIGRIIVGIAVGFASMTVPPYVAEACPGYLRGILVTVYQLLISFGMFLSSLVNASLSYLPRDINWRLMLGISGIPSLIQFIGFLFLPESPRWLATHGRYGEAQAVMEKMRSSKEEADQELREIYRAKELKDQNQQAKTLMRKLILVLTTPSTRRALVVGCTLQMFQQLSGINTIMYYSASIIEMSGVRDKPSAIWISCFVTGANFVFTFVGIYLVSRIGRKQILLASMAGVIVSLCLMGIGFSLIYTHSPDVSSQAVALTANRLSSDSLLREKTCHGFTNCAPCVRRSECGFCFSENETDESSFGHCLAVSDDDPDESALPFCSHDTRQNSDERIWAYNWCPTSYSFLPIVSMVIYLCAFSVGLAPMPWLINTEIYPQWARSTCIGCATATNWTFNLIISISFLSLSEAITTQGAMFLYAGFTFLGFIWFFIFLPETKGYTLEEVDTLFQVPLYSNWKQASWLSLSSSVVQRPPPAENPDQHLSHPTDGYGSLAG